jgi:hypothetical protein
MEKKRINDDAQNKTNYKERWKWFAVLHILTLIGWIVAITLGSIAEAHGNAKNYFIIWIVFGLYLIFLFWGIYILKTKNILQSLIYWSIITFYLYGAVITSTIIYFLYYSNDDKNILTSFLFPCISIVLYCYLVGLISIKNQLIPYWKIYNLNKVKLIEE